jgi:arylsulfatase A-like enzyme
VTAANVVVVLADDLGFSDLGCYGGEIATPHLDRLGRAGVRMSSFYNTARCSPSRASLLTGRHPHETGIGILTGDGRPDGYPGTLSLDVPTMAELLSDLGYRTGLVGKWHLSSDVRTPNASWPTRRGFDEFYGTLAGAGAYFHPRRLFGEADTSLFVIEADEGVVG